MELIPHYNPSLNVPTDLYRILPFTPLHPQRNGLPFGSHLLGAQAIANHWQMCMQPLHELWLSIQLDGLVEMRGRTEHPFSTTIKSGDIWLLPPRTPITFTAHGKSTAILVTIAPQAITALLEQIETSGSTSAEFVHQIGHGDQFLSSVGQAMVSALQTGGFAANLYLESLTQTVILHLLRTYTVFPSRPTREPRNFDDIRLRRLRDYIHEHSNRNFTLAELAAVVGLSPYHLSRLFKRRTGQSLHGYILAQRLTFAKQLLESSDLTISEIADRLGFADHSHFSRHFKRRFGAPPSAVERPSRR